MSIHYPEMDDKTFNSFLKSYSQNVDSAADVSAFWRLSDAIITEIIKREIAPYCNDNSVVVDAGGGTGR